MVLANGDAEYDVCDALESMGPFFPFWELTADIKHATNMCILRRHQ
jgi:hypothetical protein